MAVTCILYNSFKENLLSLTDSIDFNEASPTTVIKAALLDDTYTPSLSHTHFDNVVGDEITGTNYAAGGAEVTGRATAVDLDGSFGYCDADDVTWTDATFDCRYAVLYKVGGTDATSPLIGYIDFGALQSPVGVNFTIQWALRANGGMVKIA